MVLHPGIQVTLDSVVLRYSLSFPSGLVVKNLSCKAGDTCVTPGLGSSHMLWDSYWAWLWSLWAEMTEAHDPWACSPGQEKPLPWTARAHNEEQTLLTTTGASQAAQW